VVGYNISQIGSHGAVGLSVGLLISQSVGQNQLEVIRKVVSKKERKECISSNW